MKPELLQHIADHPGQTKSELAENFSVTVFEIAGPLAELMNEGRIYRYTHERRQVYGVPQVGGAA